MSQVTIYTKPKCETCKLASRVLTRAKIPHRMVDLTLDVNAEHRAFVDGLGAKGVPVIVSEFHDPIIGFRPDELKALIEAYKSASHQLASTADDAGPDISDVEDLTQNEKETDGP